MRLILASQSPERLNLLKSIDAIPEEIIVTDIDETPKKLETPKDLAIRLSYQKSLKALESVNNAYIITADTVAAVGRRILGKALLDEDVQLMLKMLSGRRHKVYTAVDIVKKQNDILIRRSKISCTTIKFKRLTQYEIESYIVSKEGIGKAGGYAIKGKIQSFIESINGSTSGVGGLPLNLVYNMLTSLGYFHGRTF